MARVADVLEAMWQHVQEEAAEDERSGRDGEWRTEWFVKSHEKGRVRYKSEEAAYEGGRYWLEHSTHPDEVEVYCQEAKVYSPETVDRKEWASA
jgi:hypothetical protein